MNQLSAPLDGHWRRLPWVAGVAFLFWGVVAYAFSLMLGHMAAVPDAIEPIDAQLIEEPATPKLAPVPKNPPPPPVREAKPVPPAPPRPSAQPVRDVPSRPAPTVETPASSTPVSLPGASLPSQNGVSREGLPVFETRPSSPPAPSGGSAPTTPTTTPPQFGAAYLNNPPPPYPLPARRMGLEGTVVCKVLVSREGKALEMEIAQSSGHEILDRAASEAIKNWRFVPARRGETAVDEWVLVPFAFRIKK